MNSLKYIFLFALAGSLLLYGCRKKEKYPAVPQIQFKSFTKIISGNGVDDKGILAITFTDGDGDVGLDVKDTNAPFNKGSEFYYNFFIKYFEKHSGIATRVDSSYCISGGFGIPITHDSRIPRLALEGDKNPLKGIIEINIAFNNPCSNYDTIMFEVYIADRAKNLSNKITTPEIIVKKR